MNIAPNPVAKRATDCCCGWAATSVGSLVVAMVALAVPVHGQVGGKAQPPKPIAPVMSQSIKESAPAPRPTSEQMPPRAPQITWDGSQLSIHCENSTLADVLRAVSERLKVPIEIPESAAAERVAADLGPSPARDVLTDLLAGSRFNYIIQASDTQENLIKTVTLSPRGSGDVATASAVVAEAPAIRRMPGHEDSQRMSRGNEGGDNSESTPEKQTASAEVEGSAQTSDRAAVASDAEQSRGAAAPVASNQDALPSEGAAGGPSSTAAVAGNPASAGTNASQDADPMTQQVQDLRSMYEERRRLQAQQNRTNTPAAPAQNNP